MTINSDTISLIDRPIDQTQRSNLQEYINHYTTHGGPASSFRWLSTTTVQRNRKPSSPLPLPPRPAFCTSATLPPEMPATRSIWVSMCRKGYLTSGNNRSAGSKSNPLLHSLSLPCCRGRGCCDAMAPEGEVLEEIDGYEYAL